MDAGVEGDEEDKEEVEVGEKRREADCFKAYSVGKELLGTTGNCCNGVFLPKIIMIQVKY